MTKEPSPPSLPERVRLNDSSSHLLKADRGLSATIQRLQSELDSGGKPRDFSEESIAALLDLQTTYVYHAGRTAISFAQHDSADVVSAKHIERADAQVRSSNFEKRYMWMESAGGVLAGAGIGHLFGVLSAADPSKDSILLATCALVCGAVLMTVGLVKSAG